MKRLRTLALLASLASPLPATVIAVTTLDDVDAAEGECSLREAIVAANSDTGTNECPAGDGADEIVLELEGTITLVTDLDPIEEALTLRGLGVNASTIDGGGTHEILHFTDASAGNGEILRVEALRLTAGAAPLGGAIFVGRNRSLEVVDSLLDGNHATLDGGAIYGDRPLSVTVRTSSLVGNTAGTGGGALAMQFLGTALVEDSTLAGNSASGGPGGAIYTLAIDSLTVRQSTLSGNDATGDGGGVAAVVTPTRLEHSTLTANTADSEDDGSGDGGGISVAGGGTVGTWVSSIVAGNQDASSAANVCPDGNRKLGAALASEGFNLLGVNDCVETTFPDGSPNLNGDLVGTSASPIDPLLSVLGDHGGPTATHLPLLGSPAIDQGDCPGLAVDQRGFGNLASGTRAVDLPAVLDLSDGCDIGSVEVGALDAASTVFADGFESGDVSRWTLAFP